MWWILGVKAFNFLLAVLMTEEERVEKHKLCCVVCVPSAGGLVGVDESVLPGLCLLSFFFSLSLHPTITMSAAVPVNIRRADADTPLPAEYSTTPHGTIYGSTPGGELYR